MTLVSSLHWSALLEPVVAVTVHDVAFAIIVLGILLTMTGALGDPNLVIVGIVVSIAGVIGVAVDPESTLLVFAAMIPVVGFLLFYLYRFAAFPRSKSPDQTSSANSLLGKRGRITEEATNRGGEVKVDRGGFDPHFQCRTEGETIAEGERVIVIARGGGNVLTVAREDEVDAEQVETPKEAMDDAGWKVIDDVQEAISRFIDRSS